MNTRRGISSIGGKREWDPSFSSPRDFRDKDEPYIESQKEYDAEGNDLELFLRDYVGKVPSSKVEDIKEFCQECRAVAESKRARAWIDDREWDGDQPSGKPRHYPNRVDSDELHSILREKRFGLDGLPNVDRRLVCIFDPDENYILTIARTTPQHLVGILRDALWKHIALQSSFKVRINRYGPPLFQLQFQLPYYALRRVRPLPMPAHPVRNLVDVSFLDIGTISKQDEAKWYLQDAEISIAITGPDNNHWTAYAFVDTCLEDITYNDEAENEDNKDDEDDGEDEDEPVEDPIFGDDLNDVLSVETPIWDAREYCLSIMDIRTRQVLEEWRLLIRHIRKCVERFRTPSLLSRTLDLEGIKKSINWILQTLELLRKLHERLSGTMRSWEMFRSPGGAIGYFSDIKRNEFRSGHLESIEESFGELENLEYALLDLVKSCEGSSTYLKLQMGVESNQLTLENNRVNLKTSSLSHDTNQITLENHKAAQKAGQTALRTYQINQIFGPVLIVLTYWSAQRDIFSFERNPKAFWISTIVMLLSFRALDFLNGPDSMEKMRAWLLAARGTLRQVLIWLVIAWDTFHMSLRTLFPCFGQNRTSSHSEGNVVIELNQDSPQPV